MDQQKKFGTNYNPEYGKIPPQAIDIEEAILGVFLLDRDSHDIIDLIEPEMFYRDSHQKIFTSVKKLRADKKQIDILTVTNDLKASELLNEVGGPVYITTLTQYASNNYHTREHYYILLDKYIARETIRYSLELSELSYSGCDVEELESKIIELKNFYESKIAVQDNGERIYDIGKISLMNSEKRMQDRRSGIMPGINTGIGKLQNTLGGWQLCDLIYIAARPSMGKSAIAIFFAKMAAQKNTKCLFFSLEMNDISITDRFILGDTIIDPEKWRNGDITNFELALYNDYLVKLKTLPLIIYDKSSIRPSDIATACKREKPGIIFIDYIQRMKCNRGEKYQNRNLELGAISGELKAIAKEYKIPVVCLSQLNRRLDASASKLPTLSDLRDSGELEQDADVVIFPFRPYFYSESFEDDGIMHLIIAKHRNGRTGKITIKHNQYINNFFDENNGFAEDQDGKPLISGFQDSMFEQVDKPF